MELWQRSACEVVALLRDGEVTPAQLIDVVEARLKELEPSINAVPITCFARARQAAKDLRIPERPPPGFLYGLPIVVKDSAAVAGVRWTQGSRIYQDRTAEQSDPHVELLEERGAIIIGKSNLPEFGAGANTFNDVFGATRNPWRLSKTAGGSSGGTAAALAAGEVWLGTGGDLGGSLRIPAAFCGVVGMRTSWGLVAQQQPARLGAVRVVAGPMARSVPDLALALDAMAGQHPRDPHSLPAPPAPFQAALAADAHPWPARVAWSPDLGGASPIDPEVAAACEAAAAWFAGQGSAVRRACPDLSDADAIFQVLRAHDFRELAGLLQSPDVAPLLKPELRWQIGLGLAQTEEQVAGARRALAALQARVAAFFQDWDLLLVPTVMVPPFDVSIRWLEQVGETRFSNYVQWLLLTFAFSLVDVPSISVPGGLTAAGLPVGLQVVGPCRADAAVLHAAAAYERAHGWKDLVPLRTLGGM